MTNTPKNRAVVSSSIDRETVERRKGKRMKLTKPQFDLLIEIEQAPRPVSDSYAPARKLVELGLCEWETIGLSTLLKVTVNGQQFLEEIQ